MAAFPHPVPLVLRQLLVAAVVAFLIAGCSDDDHSHRSATATATAGSTATATVPRTVVVTVVNSPGPSRTAAATGTPTSAATDIATPAPSATASSTATWTPLPSSTGTPTASSTAPPSATNTVTNTTAPSDTATPTHTPEPSDDTPTASPTRTPAVANPLIEGPVTGGRNAPFVQTTNFALSAVGYQQAEYYVTGTAQAYINDDEFGTDGMWQAKKAGTAPYKTRIVVYRPIDPQHFNGSVLVEWLNVSGGLDTGPDWTFTHTELTREGYVWVGVSAQRVGIEGSGGTLNLGLKTVDPIRYGSLNHPGDSYSYDMFSQVAQAVRDPQGSDPLGGLRPQRVIAIGESQSAFRLVTYVNAVHPLVRLFDGFFIHSRANDGAPLSQAPQPDVPVPSPAFIRTDLQEPVLVFETETDVILLGYQQARQADGSRFRSWETAGTAHADTYSLIVGYTDEGDSPDVAEVIENARPVPGFIVCERPINSGYQHFVAKAAIAALDRWVRGEGEPPTSPLLEVADGAPPQFRTDEFGNALGGIRTPAVDVPIATLSGLGQTGGDNFCGIFGTTVKFDSARLSEIYPTHAGYVAAVDDATDAAVAAGFIRPADAPLIKEQAEQSNIGG
jgi:hypothetical protein